MFKRIEQYKEKPYDHSYMWRIVDTDFIEDTGWYSIRHPVFVLEECYSQRKLDVIAILKEYYSKSFVRASYINRIGALNNDLQTFKLEPLYGSMQFETKYYPCLKRNFDRLNWIGI